MFLAEEDLTLHITRGDAGEIVVRAIDETTDGGETPYIFKAGEVLRLKVYEKKNCSKVVLQKDYPVVKDAETVTLALTEADTKIGDTISKPVDYWYEIELNPFTEPQTIVGYDEDGAKILRLYPEGLDAEVIPPTEEELGTVDKELSLTSEKPIQNQAVTRAIVQLESTVEKNNTTTVEELAKAKEDVALLNARVNNLAKLNEGSTTGDAELIDARVGYNRTVYDTLGEAVRMQVGEVNSYFTKSKNLIKTIIKGETVASNGKFVALANKQRTDYIFLPPNTYTYSNKGKEYSSFSFCVYRFDKTTQSYVFEKRYAGAENTTFTLTEAKYVALSDGDDAIIRTDLQLEVGSVATDYEPYKPVTVDVTEQVNNAHFKGKTILFYGDSITNGIVSSYGSTSYPSIVGEHLGINVINESQGGGTIAYKSGGTKSSLIDRIRDDSFDVPIDCVYIAMGTNDWAYTYTPVGTMEDRITDDFYENGETTTFYASLHYLINLLYQRYPAIPIIFATPIKRKTVETATVDYQNGNGKSLKDYCNIIKEVCDYYSIPVIDMYSECCLNPYLDYHLDAFFLETDRTEGATNGELRKVGTHPNAVGLNIMARRVVAGLRSIIGF